jgi:GPN-loop GTPase
MMEEGSQNVVSKKEHDRPKTVIVMGMAGSGKTTLMRRLCSYLNELKIPLYAMNLDPAVLQVPFPASIDIRDTIKYKEVMKQ